MKFARCKFLHSFNAFVGFRVGENLRFKGFGLVLVNIFYIYRIDLCLSVNFFIFDEWILFIGQLIYI